MKYFKEEEFACKCGCGLNNCTEELKDVADSIREFVGFPITINSASRCAAHNTKIKGYPNSSHLKGLALDISCSDDEKRYKLVEAASEYGVTRFGIAKTFIHIDIDPDKNKRRIWLY